MTEPESEFDSQFTADEVARVGLVAKAFEIAGAVFSVLDSESQILARSRLVRMARALEAALRATPPGGTLSPVILAALVEELTALVGQLIRALDERRRGLETLLHEVQQMRETGTPTGAGS